MTEGEQKACDTAWPADMTPAVGADAQGWLHIGSRSRRCWSPSNGMLDWEACQKQKVMGHQKGACMAKTAAGTESRNRSVCATWNSALLV